MKNKRIRITLTLMALGLLCLFAVAASANQAEEESYAFGIKPEKMQVVVFTDGDPLHDLHVEFMEDKGEDCTVCHSDEENYTFMEMAQKDQKNIEALTAYVHKSCVDCHVKWKVGPKITSCRTCHTGVQPAATN